MHTDDRSITELLHRSRDGDTDAPQVLADLIHREMRKLAAGLMRSEREGHTLQPTALVNEAWIRMRDHMDQDWRDRRQFFAAASSIMRRVLVDFARSRRRVKRGGGAQVLQLADFEASLPDRSRDVEFVDEALRELEKMDPRKVRIIELRYFGGLTVDEIAEELGLSASTIGRDLRMASVWIASYVRR